MAHKQIAAAFAAVIRKERLAKGLSQEDLAHEAGLHRTYVGLIERGLRNPTIAASHAIALALETTLSRLIREAEEQL